MTCGRGLPLLFIRKHWTTEKVVNTKKADLRVAIANLKVTSKPTHNSRTGTQWISRAPARIGKDSRVTASVLSYVPPRRIFEVIPDTYLPEKGRAWALEVVQVELQTRDCYCWDPPSPTGLRQLYAEHP